MKKSILLLLTITISVLSINAQNAVDGKGQRKGEWFIPYTYSGSLPFYDYMSKLLNLDKILTTENESDKEADNRIFEKVSYNKGIKQGEFSIYSATKNNQGKYPQIAAGEYKDGKINGNVLFLDYGNQKPLCSAIYENGKIKDQEIAIVESKGGNEGMYSTSQETFVLIGSQKVYPLIKIKNGICIEETVTVHDKYKIVRFIKKDNGFTRYLYGRNMLSGIIDLSNCLHVSDLDENFKLNGQLSIYEETKIPFDTTLLNHKATYKNGDLNGAAYWYDAKTGKAMMECNYADGLLNGIAKFKAASGQTYVEANYKNGLLNGSFVTYYLNDGSFLSLTGPICETNVNTDIYKIASSNANTKIFKETIPMLRKDGPILTDGKFKFFEAQYENGKLIGKNHYYHSDGKKLYEGTASNCELADWYWYDTNGKVIYSKQEEDKLTQQAKDILNKHSQQQNSSNQNKNNNENLEISEVRADGQTARIYHNGQDGSYYSVNLGSSGRLAGYNSKYIVTQDRQSGFIYNSKGEITVNRLSLCAACTILNVTGTYIIVQDGSNTIYYDFNGNIVRR
jgi:antitoxin component YwqK of YwqJK toxin-antitoxin module